MESTWKDLRDWLKATPGAIITVRYGPHNEYRGTVAASTYFRGFTLQIKNREQWTGDRWIPDTSPPIKTISADVSSTVPRRKEEDAEFCVNFGLCKWLLHPPQPTAAGA